MTIVRWGILPLFIAAFVFGWGVWLLPVGLVQWIGLAIAAGLWLFCLAFFRNPKRTPQHRTRGSLLDAFTGRIRVQWRQ